MEVPIDRRQRIVEITHSLWDDFSETISIDGAADKRPLAERLLQRPKSTSIGAASDVLVAFFEFCAELFAPPTANGVEANVMKRNLQDLTPRGGYRPASWLLTMTDSSGVECVSVLIDVQCLQDSLSVESAWRTKNHLLLHEIGHLVLHWQQMRPANVGTVTPLAKSATPVQEAEAWWFCYSLLGYAVSQCAFTNKQDPKSGDDQIWTMPWR